jgi:hypothetical protein
MGLRFSIVRGRAISPENSMNIEQLVQAQLVDKAIERLRQYMVRGRPLAGLSEQALHTKWVEAYRAATVSDDERSERKLADLRSEYALRRAKPPMHLVAGEVAIVVERMKRNTREYHVPPEEKERIDDEMEDLRARLRKPKH